ncbi:MAG: peptidase S8, partial [Dehalococcoidia bacterium]|nr:peptidase S8 [Dehalococcoidia bacterium]
MRYAVISKGLPLDRIEAEARKAGARELKSTRLLGQVFCEMDEGQAQALALVPGLVVKPVQEYRTHQVLAAAPPVQS